MKIEVLNSFIRDLKKIKDKDIKSDIKNIISDIENSSKLQDIKNLKKMSVYNEYYRT